MNDGLLIVLIDSRNVKTAQKLIVKLFINNRNDLFEFAYKQLFIQYPLPEENIQNSPYCQF